MKIVKKYLEDKRILTYHLTYKQPIVLPTGLSLLHIKTQKKLNTDCKIYLKLVDGKKKP